MSTPKVVRTLIAVVALVVGIGFMVSAWQHLRIVYPARFWPSTEVASLEHSIDKIPMRMGNKHFFHYALNLTWPSSAPQEVRRFSTREQAETFFQTQSHRWTVHVNPKDPAQSFHRWFLKNELQKGLERLFFAAIFVSGGIIVVCRRVG